MEPTCFVLYIHYIFYRHLKMWELRLKEVRLFAYNYTAPKLRFEFSSLRLQSNL